MVCNLQHFRPLESAFALRVETFNEFTILVLLSLQMGLTDFVPDAATRNKISFAYMGVTIINICANLALNLGQSLNLSRKRILRWWYKRMAEQLRATQVEIWDDAKEQHAAKLAQKQEERKTRRERIY